MEIPADPECLAEARRFAEEATAEAGLPDPGRYLLVVAVHEAVVNAMQHGSRGGGPVRITSCVDARAISFAVADNGEEFPLRPNTSPNLEDCGRGLTLMFHGVDEITERRLHQGKEIRMTKWLQPPA